MSIWSWKTTEPSGRADVALFKALESSSGEWSGSPISCSRSQLQRLIEEGRVSIDGRPLAKANTILRAGSEIRVEFPAPRPLAVEPEEREIDILFQDEHLLVINKPPGLTVHPSSTRSAGTLVNALLHHVRTGAIGDLSGIGGVLRPGIVHRLDKDTSGALVVSKTDVAHRALVEIFSRHAIERRYWAICHGRPAWGEHRMESLIGRNPADRKKMAMDVKGGRKAITHLKRLEEFAAPGAKPCASLIEARLETGRTHQVRVHLTAAGHSLLGDPVYGTPSEKQPKWLALPASVRAAVRELPGQALHARVLGFEHPVTGRAMRFEAEPPAEFARLLARLREIG